MKVGIFSGTFDPVHAGHIAFCEAVLQEFGLDRVVLLPERHPRHKTDVTDFSHRVAMLTLATKDMPHITVEELDDTQFTVGRTLPELQERFGGDLTMMIGSDVVKGMAAHPWPGLDVLFKEVELVVALRQGDSKREVEDLLDQLGHPVRFQCVESPLLHIASTHIRQGGGAEEHLDPHVKHYIASHKFYDKRSS